MKRIEIAAALVIAMVGTGCSGSPAAPTDERPASDAGVVDVGGYELAYTCEGAGSPTVLLEAGLDSAGTSTFFDFLPQLGGLDTTVCTYDRAGTGASDARPKSVGTPTAELQARELHALVGGAGIEPPFVLVPHSYGGLIARMYADLYPDEVAGFVFEDVSTAWEVDLWPRWDDSPWIDGGQVTDIDATERQVLNAEPLGARPAIVLSAGDNDDEGIPAWAKPIFLRQAARLAALGTDTIHAVVRGSGHFIHDEEPTVVADAITAVVEAVRDDGVLPACDVALPGPAVECLS